MTDASATASVRLRVALAQEAADYIEHARTETLRSINMEVRPERIQQIPHAVYVLAYTESGRVAGMAEAFLHNQHYESYDDAPYGSVAGLRELCPFELMAGIRTTNAADQGLARLYHRTGGLRLGVFGIGEWSAEGAALYAFEVERLLRHPGLERTLKDTDLDFARIQTIRHRNRWNTAPA